MGYLQLFSTFISSLALRCVTNILHNHEKSDVVAVRYLGQHDLGLHDFSSIIQINVQIVPYPSKCIFTSHAQLSSDLTEGSAVKRS